MTNVFKSAGKRLVSRTIEEISLADYLELCKTDKLAYATPSERLLAAIGEAEKIDTRKDQRLGRIFSNETISVYTAFKKIYGIETAIKDIVSFVTHAAQGLEERKQIMYLKGPVGSSKSSIVHILKRLMETIPFYAIKGSPVNDNPLSLFSKEDALDLGIPERYFSVIPSGWLLKRLQELDGDLSKISIVKRYPSEAHQIAMSHVEPGDENNQDISSLVGKINMREIENYPQNDPDAYSYSGGLCLGNRGIVEFAEMFKSPIKSLNPLLEATQSGFYKGTEAISAIPFDGIIIAHSNESEWSKFRNDKRNEALIDRIYLIDVPYCLRYDEETKIYDKLLKESSLSEAPCAPKTLEILAQFSVMSRLMPSKHSARLIKMKIYNGENLRHTHPNSKNVPEYKQEAHDGNIDEGFFGISTRFAFKILAQTFNYDTEEVGANPLHLLLILNDRIKQEHLTTEEETALLTIITTLYTEFKKSLDKDIKKAYIESYEEYGQNYFDRYVTYADFWLKEDDYRDPVSQLSMTPADLEKYLEEVESAASIGNKKDFRNEVVMYCLRYRAQHNNKNPAWTSYNKIKEVLEAKIFSNLDDMLPIVSSNTQASADEKRHHQDFVKRMVSLGYTPRMVTILVDWYIRASKE